jgi:hypothetical protein
VVTKNAHRILEDKPEKNILETDLNRILKWGLKNRAIFRIGLNWQITGPVVNCCVTTVVEGGVFRDQLSDY